MPAERVGLALFATVAVLFSSCSPSDGDSPPAKRSLSVVLNGQGTVRSQPAGIDCGATCQASFDSTQMVSLTATAADGYRFDGWAGACGGTDSCQLMPSSDMQVIANFVALAQSQNPPQPPPQNPPPQTPPPQPPPPPSDVPPECAGLMPQNPIGDGIAVPLPDTADYSRATSDDVNGNFVLIYGVDFNVGHGSHYPALRFFTIQDGHAVQLGQAVNGSGDGGLKVWSQPSGFTIYLTNGVLSTATLFTYSHDGVFLRSEVITPSVYAAESLILASVAVDPSGGTAVARTDRMTTPMKSTYQRYGKDGAPEFAQVDIGTPNEVARVGVSLSGDVLVFVTAGQNSLAARWFKRDGSPLTDWFPAPTPVWGQASNQNVVGAFGDELAFLADGSLLMSDYSGAHYVFPDATPRVDPPPQWLQERPLTTVYLIRGGRAHGVARSPKCNGSFEVLTPSGATCGCLDGPDLTSPYGAPTPNAFIGRDGSLIVYRLDAGGGYRLYPKLLQ